MSDSLEDKKIVKLPQLLAINSRFNRKVLDRMKYILKSYQILSYEPSEKITGFYDLKMSLRFSGYEDKDQKSVEEVELLIKPNKNEMQTELIRDNDEVPLNYYELIAVRLSSMLFNKGALNDDH